MNKEMRKDRGWLLTKEVHAEAVANNALGALLVTGPVSAGAVGGEENPDGGEADDGADRIDTHVTNAHTHTKVADVL